jgi:hypothetical protein
MLRLLVAFLCYAFLPFVVEAQDVDPVTRIDAAILALPEPLRAGAHVLGLSEDAELVTLREGSNRMICLADDPGNRRFHVACYHDSLEPFMARGRELRREGHDREEVASIRRSEIESGSLAFPSGPVALYSLTGDYESIVIDDDVVRGATRLHVVYLPYATLEDTGLPARAPQGQPWLMDPGEPWAHMMMFEVQPMTAE